MRQMMKKMGMSQVEIPATEVVIKTPDREIVIINPQVSKVNMMGQETFQIVGEAHERPVEVEVDEADVETVVEQTGVSPEDAKAALEDAGGDIAQAIMNLK